MEHIEKFDVSLCANFSDFLRKQYELRRDKNPKFSLRSFANKLGVDQSLVSKVLNGKRDLSFLSMKNCLERMEIQEPELSELLAKFSRKVVYHRAIEEDVFTVVSHWSHFAILELFKLENFSADVNEIAERLNLTQIVAEESLQRLERFNFLSLSEGRYSITRSNNDWASHTVTSDARRALQKTFLEKSIHALETVPIEKRHHGSYTFAVDSTRVKELKEKIAEFNFQIANMSAQHENLNEVYQFQVSLFPLTQLKDH